MQARLEEDDFDVLGDMFTVRHLGVGDRLARTLTSTNPIESMISISRSTARNVKRWRDGTMIKRWCAAGMLNAQRSFRRVKGCKDMPALIAALQRHVEAVTPTRDTQEATGGGGVGIVVVGGLIRNGPSPNFNNERDILSNDAWRHSKWLAMMERRVRLAKRLLKSDGVLVVTIDEHKLHHLGMLIERLFPEYVCYVVSIVVNAPRQYW